MIKKWQYRWGHVPVNYSTNLNIARIWITDAWNLDSCWGSVIVTVKYHAKQCTAYEESSGIKVISLACIWEHFLLVSHLRLSQRVDDTVVGWLNNSIVAGSLWIQFLKNLYDRISSPNYLFCRIQWHGNWIVKINMSFFSLYRNIYLICRSCIMFFFQSSWVKVSN